MHKFITELPKYYHENVRKVLVGGSIAAVGKNLIKPKILVHIMYLKYNINTYCN